MTYYKSKYWRLKYRVDPDSGRVLCIGPYVINFDVVRSYAKTRGYKSASPNR